jgi:hypothetical protein
VGTGADPREEKVPGVSSGLGRTVPWQDCPLGEKVLQWGMASHPLGWSHPLCRSEVLTSGLRLY